MLVFALKREGADETIVSEDTKVEITEQEKAGLESIQQETSSEPDSKGLFLMESAVVEELDVSADLDEESADNEEYNEERAETVSEESVVSLRERYKGSDLLLRVTGGTNENLSVDSISRSRICLVLSFVSM